MIKRFFLISFLALASLALFAQQNANGIRGIVVEEDGTPVMYASVAMIQNGKAAAGALTDTTGLFVMKGTFKGSYQLKITSIGHEDVLKDLMLSDGKSHDLGQIVMTERAMLLDGVVVTGRSADKSVTLEKTSINAAASMSAATGSVLDMLRGSSAVSVDGAGQVSIRGNSNVLILVDGVPTALDGLGGYSRCQRAEY